MADEDVVRKPFADTPLKRAAQLGSGPPQQLRRQGSVRRREAAVDLAFVWFQVKTKGGGGKHINLLI